MKQPKKVKKQPDLKRRLDRVTPTPDQEVTVHVTLPVSIYRAIEAMAGSDIAAWVRAVVIDTVEGKMAAEELLTEEETRTDS